MLRLFPFYILTSSIQSLFTFLCIAYNPENAREINNYSIYLFIMVEFIVVYHFLFQTIKTSRLRLVMRALQLFFWGFMIYIWYETRFYKLVPPGLTIINCICIAIPCIFYFYEIFTRAPLISLTQQPDFWIATGFLFMVVCTLPFYCLETFITENMITSYNQVYTLNYFFYCLLFLLITKAFLCKQQTVK